MAANVPNPGLFLQATAAELTALRDGFARLVNRADYITGMGGAGFLTAAAPNGLGMAQGDADALVAALGNHANLATQYRGGAQAPVLDYRSNGRPFWGGM